MCYKRILLYFIFSCSNRAMLVLSRKSAGGETFGGQCRHGGEHFTNNILSQETADVYLKKFTFLML